MTVLLRPFYILVLLLVGPVAIAHVGENITLSGDLFGRSSANFASQSNIQSVVPSGSTATVLETRVLPSGSLGVRVRISSIGGNRGSDTAKVGDETWIYRSNSRPWFNLSGASNSAPAPQRAIVKAVPVDEDENAMGPDPNDNMGRTFDRRSTEGSACIDCYKYKPPTPTAAKKNQEDLRAVSQTRPAGPINARYTGSNESTWAQFPEVVRYSSRPETQKMISTAIRNQPVPSEKKWCYRYVKRAAQAAGLVKTYPPGTYAARGVRDLKAQGWKNMLDNPTYRAIINGDSKRAPKGAIIIYDNDGSKPPHWGDSHIKTGSSYTDGFISDFYTPNSFLSSPKARQAARDGVPYRVIGVMIKP